MASEVRTTCCYCGVGCGVIVSTDGQQVLGVRGDPDHPANFGRLCSKGSNLHQTARPLVQQQVRALAPALRVLRQGVRAPVSWEYAVEVAAGRIANAVQAYGPDSVAFYISGQLLTEDYYVFNKFAKGLLGTNNIDSNSRLCMSSAVAGYKQTLGADAPPACYEDIALADVVFIAGANMAYAHPVLYRRLEAARAARPEMKIIVADPRRTDTAAEATLHLPILPGTDVALFNGMLHLCLWEGFADQAFIAAHTEGFDAIRDAVRDFTPAHVAAICGIPEADLLQAARWFGSARAALSLYCQGLNQSSSGTAKNAALINLHLATGQIGKPGAGPFSLTGQPNAMGGREVGGMANLLSAHRDLADPQQRAEVAALWGVDAVPAERGLTAVEMFEAAAEGRIKVLWIACTNPAQSMPDQKLVRAALEKVDFVIVQEAFASTATVAYADLLLPATTWAEKEGTVTNSERRITRVRAALPKPGQARHDWEIAAQVARAVAAKLEKPGIRFDYPDPESVWNEHRASTRGRDLDITGLSYALLEQQGAQQWPYPEGAQAGRQRLYEDGVFPTPSGRARFVPTPYVPVAEPADARYPFQLNTGRLRDQWHGMSRTATSPQAFAHVAEPSLQMAPDDMARRGLAEGDLVHVTSRRATLILPVRADPGQRRGQVFMPMHWGPEYVSGRGPALGVNGLTVPAIDPKSFQPELKNAAVKVLKAELPWRFAVFAWVDEAQALRLQARLRSYYGRFAFAACTLFGRERCGVLFRAADDYAAAPALVSEIEALFGIEGALVLRYEDTRRGNARRMLVRDGQLQAVALAGDTAAEQWLRQLLETGADVRSLGRLLLSPSATAPQGFKARGKVVCSCLGVAEAEIAACLAAAAPGEDGLARLQGELKCGTSCGSCVPELKRMVAAAAQV
ncbi:molybdopterin oxidoreductase family protein [Massilia sp. TS11]|uniref:molybdopterin oxidoreductase family protein n=1 Tax=Massilia sp. TS11 TaxID=2908003 RepID=UPI001ED9DE45|nr:nitrate reductase [Massilia sp. TS11]MCG2583557.1 molybdopterin-dependent oxidoreductase [Massilia sp. TS11]